jgi:PAS domain S-box-containing protein
VPPMTDQRDIFKTIIEFDERISRMDSDQIVMEALLFLQKQLNFVRVSLNLLTPDGSGFKPVVIDPQDSEIPIPEFIPQEVTHLSEVIKSGQPIYRPDISNGTTKYAIDGQLVEWGVKSDFVVPLILEKVSIGTLNCGSAAIDGIDSEMRQLLTLMTPRLAYAIQVTRLLEQSRQSEQRFRNIYDHSLAAIYTFDNEKYFTDTNQAGVDLLGYSRQELLQKCIAEVDANPKVVLPAHKQLLAGDNLVNYEHQLRCKDGSVITVLNNSIPLRDVDGNLTGLQSYLFDITDRRRLEEIFNIKRELALDALKVTNLDKCIKMCTSAAIRIAGMDSGGCYLIDETTGDLHLQYTEGLGEDLVSKIGHYEARSINADLVHSGKNVYVRGAELEALLLPIFLEEGIRSFLTMPFRNDDRVVGCLNIASHEQAEVPPLVQKELESLGLQVGSIIARIQMLEKLKESESRYRRLFESTTDGVLISDQKGVVVDTNAAAASILGYDEPADLIGTRAIDLYSDPEERTRMYEQLNISGSLANMELHPRHRDGSTSTVLASGSIEQDRNKNVLSASFIFTDITERKQMETALRKSEELFRTIAYFNYDWEYWIDREGKFRYISPSVERITGYSPDDFLQDPELYRSIIHPDDLPQVLDHRHELLRDGNPKPVHFRLTHRDGSERWIGHHCVPVVSQQGENLGRRGSNRDVTAQIEMEQALRGSEARYMNLLELLPEAVVETDLSGTVTFMNQRGYDILGYDGQNLDAIASVVEFVIPEDREQVVTRIQRLFKGESLDGVEYTGLRRDGSTFPVVVYANVIMEAGEPKGVRAIVVDLSKKA